MFLDFIFSLSFSFFNCCVSFFKLEAISKVPPAVFNWLSNARKNLEGGSGTKKASVDLTLNLLKWTLEKFPEINQLSEVFAVLLFWAFF